MTTASQPGSSSTGTARDLRDGATILHASPRMVSVIAAVPVAWFIALAAELTGTAILLHHHTLIEGGPPLWIGLPAFLLAWQVMVAAMMLPASLPAIGSFDAAGAGGEHPSAALASYVTGYALVWTGYAVAAFTFDIGLHHLADANPWLGDRPWLIEGTAVLAAAIYQFLPLKMRGLEACRHPSIHHADGARPGAGRHSAERASSMAAGVRHGVDCLVSSWALMLLMFAAGFANVWWMAALAGAMAFETFAPNARRSAAVIGLILLALAAAILVLHWIPAFTET